MSSERNLPNVNSVVGLLVGSELFQQESRHLIVSREASWVSQVAEMNL